MAFLLAIPSSSWTQCRDSQSCALWTSTSVGIMCWSGCSQPVYSTLTGSRRPWTPSPTSLTLFLGSFIFPCEFSKTRPCLSLWLATGGCRKTALWGRKQGWPTLAEKPNRPKATHLLQGWKIMQWPKTSLSVRDHFWNEDSNLSCVLKGHTKKDTASLTQKYKVGNFPRLLRVLRLPSGGCFLEHGPWSLEASIGPLWK